MEDSQMTAGVEPSLVQVWVTVTTADGSTRLESRWAPVEAELVAHPTYAA